MIRRALLGMGLVAASLPAAGVLPGPCETVARAQGMNHAGLIISFPAGATKEFCVAFEEPSISGLELLRRSGLPLTFQDFGGGNVTVCSIDGEGCPYPEKPCFCLCESTGGDCRFWGYYRASSGRWHFSETGAGVRPVRDGEVEGWKFGAHGTAGADPPPQATLNQLCNRGTRIGPAAASASRRPVRAADGPGVAAVGATSAVAGALIAAALLVKRLRRRGEEVR